MITSTSDDPRRLPGYIPELMPRCNGAAVPAANGSDPVEDVMGAFARVYYRMNLAKVAVGKAKEAGSADALREAEESFLRASGERDALEDEWLSRGLYADPIQDGEFYTDLHFQFPPLAPKPHITFERFNTVIKLS